MARINVVNDVVAPLAVAAVDIVIQTQPTMAPYREWAQYAMTVGGYLGAYMGYGGDFVKNVGIASLPLTAKTLYQKYLNPSGATPITYPVARMSQTQVPGFGGVKLV
jgi:hypothetical protein